MEELDLVIQEATAAIDAMYFQLPVDGGDPVYRERVYCYELYHQMGPIGRFVRRITLRGNNK